jgi:hypothetical protein
MMYAKTLFLGLLVSSLVFAGCSGDGKTPKNGDTAGADTGSDTGDNAEDHAPHGAGPNGGVVFDLGKYHAEFTVDHPQQECMILVLGDDEKTPTPVAATEFTLTTKETKTEDGKAVAPMTIKMLPQDAQDGKATRFVGTDPGIGNVADFAGTVIGEIDGKPSQGEFQE